MIDKCLNIKKIPIIDNCLNMKNIPMVNIYLYTENVSSDFLKIYNFYFQNFSYNYINKVNQNDKNLIYIKKELYTIKGFEAKLKNILNNKEPVYLSKCKNIIFLPANSYNIIDTKITYEEIELKSCIIFENHKYSPIVNSKYESLDYETAQLCYKFKDKKIIYNKNIPISNINAFIKYKLNKVNFYYIITYIDENNYNDILDKIKNNKYKYCRYVLINKIKDFDTMIYNVKKINILIKFKKKYIQLISENKLYSFITNNILFFEKMIIFNNYFNLDIINTCHKFIDYYKIYINENFILIPANYFIKMPIFDSNSKEIILPNMYKMILLNISFYNEKEIYCNIENYKKYLESKPLPKNYDTIELKMNIIKDYDNLLILMDEHILKVTSNQNAAHLLLKKISIAILTKNENILSEAGMIALSLFEDIELLKTIYLMIKFSSFKKAKENILIKIIDKLNDDDKTFIIYYSELSKDIGNSTYLKNFYDITLKKKDIILSKINKILLFNLLFNTIAVNKNYENTELFTIFNNLIISLNNDNTSVLTLENQIELYKKGIIDKNILTFIILSISSKFDSFNKSYDEFIKARENIKNNFNKIQDLFDLNVKLDNISMYPIDNFQLSYQGLPSKDIFILKNNLYRKICQDLNYKIDTNFKNDKIKILFHAQQLNRTHSVYKDRHQVIKNLSFDERFDVYFSTFDNIHSEIKFTFGNAKHIKLETNLQKIKETLTLMKLDILVFCEIGMYNLSYYMAYMKLAKIQCNTWGHSDTSGIDSIDYYFSSKLYELPYNEAQTHYSEKLILQNSLCTSYVNPLSKHNIESFKNRFHFGLTDDTIVYFCAQSLFKINPVYDEYIIKILQNVPNSIIIFLDGDKKPKILERLNNHGIGSQIKFFPPMQHNNYMNIISISDIFLDIYPFGGCNSSFEAFSLNKVIVTQPSIMINGRFTSGFYKKMGLDEYICNSKENYIDFAIKLGKDKEYRQSIEKRIADNNACLFLDQETITEWKDDLIKIYDNYHEKIDKK